MKSTEFHGVLRPALATWAKQRRFKRVSSAPPAFEFQYATHAFLSLWVQLGTGGYDWLIGGRFTLNVKIGQEIGLHTDSTVRLPSIWSGERAARALALDAAVRAKRGRPRGAHPFETFATKEEIESRYYTPIHALPGDYWMPYVDVEDVSKWSSLVVESLDDVVLRVIEKGRAGGFLVPEVWPTL